MCIRDRVDRIIPGVGKDAMEAAWQQVGFPDKMITQGEPYHLWAIEAPLSVRAELLLDKVGLNIIYTCLLYTSDAADERSSVDLGGRRIIKKKNNREDH